MLPQNVATEGIDLTMETNREPRPLKAKVKSPDTGEKRCHCVGQSGFSLAHGPPTC